MIEGQEGVTWQDWCALADACEQHGVETLFRSDHYISQGDESRNVAHDAWTTISALAARTSKLRFGTLVSPATFRAPGLLANAAATADHVSGGRIELGLGAGWNEREHRAYGFPFPEMRTRVEMLAEQVEIVHRLWTEERVDFHGRHYTLEDAPGQPRPIQQPRPPLLVGGGGARGTVEPALRFAEAFAIIRGLLREGRVDFDGTYYRVEDCILDPPPVRPGGPPLMLGSTGPRMMRIGLPHVDAWNVWWSDYGNTPDGFAAVRERVEDAAVDAGRARGEVAATAAVLVGLPGGSGRLMGDAYNAAVRPVRGSAADIADHLRAMAAAGASHLQLVVDPITRPSIEALADTLTTLDRT